MKQGDRDHAYKALEKEFAWKIVLNSNSMSIKDNHTILIFGEFRYRDEIVSNDGSMKNVL